MKFMHNRTVGVILFNIGLSFLISDAGIGWSIFGMILVDFGVFAMINSEMDKRKKNNNHEKL